MNIVINESRSVLRWLWRHRRGCIAVAAFTCAIVCASIVVLLAIPVDPHPYLTVRSSGELVDRSNRLMYPFLNDDEQWVFARSLNEISPYLVQATIATEDQRFRRHYGVDPIAVARAAWQNAAGGGIRSGASTLTMQVVKQRDEVPRSIGGKVYQAAQAIRLEHRASKDEILTAYLNSAPYGLNLVGCESASRRYFGKPAKELTLPEAALLAGLPKSPVGLMPLDHPENALRRRNFVLTRMRDEGFIDASRCEAAMKQPLGATWNEFPQLAPHLAMRLRGQVTETGIVQSTIESDLQTKAERMARESLKQFDNQITNAAVLILDAPTATVLARVGSADFYETPGGGQVDATRALRSPGSTLKPFTYALAIERKALYGSEILLDDSLDYGLYNPENYDGKYRGLISASYALRRSLNVPAVMVLHRVGEDALYKFLHQSGITTLVRPAEYYGLGLTLGNCEVRLDQLAAAYCMLANLGEYRPLRERTDEMSPPAKRLLARGTCLELYTMLEQPLPAEFQKDIVSAVGYTPRVCWKTGTSTGLHDAWTVVFNSQYVVVVWLGNNNGKSSNRLVGARAALPLAAQLFRSLPVKPGIAWPNAGDDMKEIAVCATSGLPVSPWCARTVTTRIPATQFTNRTCDVHCPTLAHADNPSFEIAERWPASAKGWDLANVKSPLPITADSAGLRSKGLRILAPANDADFVLTSEANADRIRLRASVDDSAQVHWYLDARYLGQSGPAESLLLDLTEGDHTLTCMAANGEQDSVKFKVDPPYTPTRFRN